MATMNEEQRAAFQDCLLFLNDPERKEHRISGGAGTGKTFFISQVADNILKHVDRNHCRCTDVHVTATTNKAAAVLSEAMPHRAMNIGTIYSHMNLRVHNDFATGEQSLTTTRNWQVHGFQLIIVDEASMVPRKLYEFINKGTSSTCKIIYVGDKNQLSPVKEDISPVYTRNISESMLVKPVRNAEQPALMELCEQLVDTVLTGKFHRIKEVPGVIDFVDGNQLKGILERDYSVENPNQRVLCYTNNRVIQYNEHIRLIRGFTEPYNVGEVMTNNSSAELVDRTRLYTDQMVRIVEKGTPYDNENIVKGYEVSMQPLTVEDVSSGAQYEIEVFADPADRAEAMRYYKSHKRWDRFFSIRDNYPDLRSIAASTTHKSQGSTLTSAIVDLADIGRSTNREQTARLQYVALSRAKHRLYIRGQLPERYFE